MELLGNEIPEACYFGCPRTDFQAIAARAAVVYEEVRKAKDAGLSEAAVAAVGSQNDGDRILVNERVEKMPAGEFARPWRAGPEAPSGTPPIQCCTLAAMIILTKTEPTLTLNSPAEAARLAADQDEQPQ